MVRLLSATLIILFLGLALLAGAAGAANGTSQRDREIQMGKEAAKEVEKDAKLITDAAIVDRVKKIGQAIASVANSVEVPAAYGQSAMLNFDYTFKVIEDKDVNAFSLPGGFIYVNTGLLDFVQSDDELAGVLAHEVAHASHHHMVQLLKEQAKLNNQIAAGLLIGILAKMPQEDLGNAMLGMELYRTAKTSGYGQKAEADADRTAVAYMHKAQYNPVGLLTFIERLARKPEVVTLGIFQTHPPSRERAKAIIEQLDAMQIPINRRAVTRAIRAESRMVNVDSETYATVFLDGEKVLRVAADDSQTAEERAAKLAKSINAILDAGVQLRDIKADDGPSVTVKGRPVIVITEADAQTNGMPAADVAKEAAAAIKRVVWKQQIDQLY